MTGFLKEVASIFGEQTVVTAMATDTVDIVDLLTPDTLKLIHDKSDAVQACQTCEQARAVIASLSDDERMILCMWTLDTNLGSELVRLLAPKAVA